MGTVVLATMGSWGDIFPAIGLANGLIEAGHDAPVRHVEAIMSA